MLIMKLKQKMAEYSWLVLLDLRTIAEVNPLSIKILDKAVKMANAPINPKSLGDKSLRVTNPMTKAMT